MTSHTPSQRAAQKVIDQELENAENRGAERVRAQLRDVLAERRRVVRHGDQQIEVVEVSAIAEVLGSEPD